MGPDRWGPESEEWVFRVNYADGDLRQSTMCRWRRHGRALGIGDHPLTIHRISRWSLEGVVASLSRWGGSSWSATPHRHRRPAARSQQRHPRRPQPVLEGGGGGARRGAEVLLGTYEAERRPVDARNVQRSLDNAFNHFAIGEALGVQPGAPADPTGRRCAGCGATGRGRAQRGRVRRDVASHRWSFASTTSSTATASPRPRLSRRQPGAAVARPGPRLCAVHAAGTSAAARLGRGRRRHPGRLVLAGAAGAPPAHRRRGGRGLVGRRGRSRVTATCRSTPSPSAISSGTTSTYAATGCGSARSVPTARSWCGRTAASWRARRLADAGAACAPPSNRFRCRLAA